MKLSDSWFFFLQEVFFLFKGDEFFYETFLLNFGFSDYSSVVYEVSDGVGVELPCPSAEGAELVAVVGVDGELEAGLGGRFWDLFFEVGAGDGREGFGVGVSLGVGVGVDVRVGVFSLVTSVCQKKIRYCVNTIRTFIF